MQKTECLSPFPSTLVRFDLDVHEIENKLMSIRSSNDHIRNKIHKVTSSFQAIQKCLGRKHQSTKSILKFTKCPPAKSAKVVSDHIHASLKKLDTNLDEKIFYSDTEAGKVNKCIEEQKFNYKRNVPRSQSLSESGSKNEINIETFPSSQIRRTEIYDSNRSINSIIRVHETLNSTMKTRSHSESTVYQTERNYSSVKVFPLFHFKDSQNKPTRPTSLFICQKNSPHDDFNKILKPRPNAKLDNIQSTQSLDKYLSNLSNEKSKKVRSEQAAEAIDSCILLMMSLINE